MDINQDIKEVENFENHAHQWWNKRGPYKLIHNLTPLRLNYLENITKIENTKILDIGCGGGLLSEELTKKGASVTGIDASEKTIKIAKNHAKENNLKIEYIHTTLDQYIKSSKKKFDIVICFELIEHVPDAAKLIENISSVINKKGYIFLSTINRNILSFIFAKVLAEYVFNIVPQGTHQYKRFIKPFELYELLGNSKFKTEDITGVKFNPIDSSFSFSSFNKINYFLSAKKI
tara:strand:+ start:838 stop:1536 length:699 start_codon:yes stop_codon:yes gene_type:complete